MALRLKDIANEVAKADNESDGWLRGIVAQGVVFITGLIIAVASYSILNVLIRQMVAEDFKQIVTETQEAVTDNIMSLQHNVRSVATIVSLSYNEGNTDLRARIVAALPADNKFERFYWVKRGSGNKWYMEELVSLRTGEDIAPEFAPGSEGEVIEHIIKNRPRNPHEVFVVPDLPGTRGRQENLDPLIESRPVAFAKTLVINAADAGVVVGMTRTSAFVDEKWLASRQTLMRLGVSDLAYGLMIFYVDKEFTGDASRATFYPDWTHEMQIGRRNWQIQLDIGKSPHTKFLEKMPWLMLAFGLMLAIIGTWFVHNNRRQSIKLRAMNRVMAQKNYALNSEMAERERLNQVLRKAEREYKAIVDAVSDIIFEARTSGEIVFLNETWQRISGFEVDQALNRSLFDLLHPQDQQEQKLLFDELVKGKRNAYRSFTRLRTADGTFRSVELAVSMLRQDESRNTRVVGTLTDVEERRRAERALGEAEKKYRQIVENAAGGIYQVTPEGQFLSANKAMARILGFDTPEQMLRSVKNVHELYVSTKDRARFVKELETAGMVNNFEIQVYTKDRRKVWVNENARAVRDDEGNILYFEGSMENVTQRKEAELKLREAKIQSDLANRAKSEFLANMSHELRTPLNAIIGFSEIIRNQVLGPIENKQYWEYARDIHDSGKRLLTIINEILDVSRIEAGERQLNEGIVNMDKVVKACFALLSPKADSGRLSLINLTADKIPKLVGEELAVKQVLLNLLSNAIKYTPAGGRVTVSHEIDATGQLRVSITDTGIGLDDSEIQKALSPFGQVDTTLSREGSGAGLGLTLVDSLMRMHGGKLELFSQKGIGTTATIVFPAKRVAQDTTAASGKTEQPTTSQPAQTPAQSGSEQKQAETSGAADAGNTKPPENA